MKCNPNCILLSLKLSGPFGSLLNKVVAPTVRMGRIGWCNLGVWTLEQAADRGNEEQRRKGDFKMRSQLQLYHPSQTMVVIAERNVHTHTHIHVHTYTDTHTHTHKHTQANTHACAYTSSQLFSWEPTSLRPVLQLESQGGHMRVT